MLQSKFKPFRNFLMYEEAVVFLFALLCSVGHKDKDCHFCHVMLLLFYLSLFLERFT